MNSIATPVSDSLLKNEDVPENLFQPSIFQLDGNITNSTFSDSSGSHDESDYSTDDEPDPVVSPANLSPIQPVPNQLVQLEVKKNLKFEHASSLPLISVMNARSLYPKKDNFKTFVKELGIEIAIVSETWERERESLEELLQLENYNVLSYRRPKIKMNRQPGGGCAIIFSEERFCAMCSSD